MSSGSLGQGVSVATGMALSAKISNASYRVYAILGDGELEEGQVLEAAMFAAHKKLDHLCAVIDFNNLQIDGSLDEVNSPCPIHEKFKAFGWNVIVIDGHDFDQIEAASPRRVRQKGSQRRLSCTRPRARVFLLWRIRPAGTAPPPTTSSMPKPCRSCEIRSASWERSKPRGFLAHSSRPCRRDRDRLNFRKKGKLFARGIRCLCKDMVNTMADKKKQATRESYGEALVELGAKYDNLIVLDADLAGSDQDGDV